MVKQSVNQIYKWKDSQDEGKQFHSDGTTYENAHFLNLRCSIGGQIGGHIRDLSHLKRRAYIR